ncbi:unnamed protein product [Parajaminaea phylloscopi]
MSLKAHEMGLPRPPLVDRLGLCILDLAWTGAGRLNHARTRAAAAPKDRAEQGRPPLPEPLRDPLVEEDTTPETSRYGPVEGLIRFSRAVIRSHRLEVHIDPWAEKSSPAHISTQPRLIQQGLRDGLEIVMTFLREKLAAAGAHEPHEHREPCAMTHTEVCRATWEAGQLNRIDMIAAEDREKAHRDCNEFVKAMGHHSHGMFSMALRHDGHWAVEVCSTPIFDVMMRNRLLSGGHLTTLLAAASHAHHRITNARLKRIRLPADFSLDPAWLCGPPLSGYEAGPSRGDDADWAATKRQLWPDLCPLVEQRSPLAPDLLEDRPARSEPHSRDPVKPVGDVAGADVAGLLQLAIDDLVTSEDESQPHSGASTPTARAPTAGKRQLQVDRKEESDRLASTTTRTEAADGLGARHPDGTSTPKAPLVDEDLDQSPDSGASTPRG